ncbi:MAG: ISAs1 family transposase [Proteobacteria bacterium]|nr:ISAs1 family transposase [Pseudomonadota bacterium]
MAEKIIEKEADYILALKGIQGNFAKNVEDFFTKADDKEYKGMSVDYYETKDVNHGRIEYRRYWTTDSIEGIKGMKSWQGLNIVGMMESERHVNSELSIEHRVQIVFVGFQIARLNMPLPSGDNSDAQANINSTGNFVGCAEPNYWK